MGEEKCYEREWKRAKESDEREIKRGKGGRERVNERGRERERRKEKEGRRESEENSEKGEKNIYSQFTCKRICISSNSSYVLEISNYLICFFCCCRCCCFSVLNCSIGHMVFGIVYYTHNSVFFGVFVQPDRIRV